MTLVDVAGGVALPPELLGAREVARIDGRADEVVIEDLQGLLDRPERLSVVPAIVSRSSPATSAAWTTVSAFSSVPERKRVSSPISR